MTSKHCTKCKELKPLSSFVNDKQKKDRLSCICKSCGAFVARRYRRTKNGLVIRIYGQQKRSSRERGYVPPNYSSIELREFVFNDVKFKYLYNNWVKSGYKKDLTPSCDRLDDYKPYTLGNLQLTTWAYNNKRHYSDMKNGINNKQNIEIVQKNKNGEIIKVFHSQCHASRVLGISQSGINRCLKGFYKTCGGFKWEYAE